MSSGHVGMALILALRGAEKGGLEGQGRHGLPRGECQRSQRVGEAPWVPAGAGLLEL